MIFDISYMIFEMNYVHDIWYAIYMICRYTVDDVYCDIWYDVWNGIMWYMDIVYIYNVYGIYVMVFTWCYNMVLLSGV